MSPLYFLLLPLFFYVMYKRIRELVVAYRSANESRKKAELLFLFLTIVISIGLVVAIELM